MKPHPANIEREYTCVVVDRYTGVAREVRVTSTTVADVRAQVTSLKTADEHIDWISE